MRVFTFVVLIYANGDVTKSTIHNMTTLKPGTITSGVDNLPNGTDIEETAAIESYPWFGLLIYPTDKPRPTTTVVVLITREIALATALDIDYYPKDDFRSRSGVILGHNCSGPYIRIKDYTFHPDFTRTTYSSLALLQLDTKKSNIKLFPICEPPEEFRDYEKIYAMSLIHDCHSTPMVRVYKMEYVDTTHCRDFYRRAQLGLKTMWPTHLACARGVRGGHCIWRSGTALVIRDDGEWKLLGLGTYGPGCESPARFLDYGMYQRWVKQSITRIGQPAITRMDQNHLILRRTLTNVQRYGPCDPEETKIKIFSDISSFYPASDEVYGSDDIETVQYNVTLLESVDYFCVTFRVWNEEDDTDKPFISIRRWCNHLSHCANSMFNIFFYIEIKFRQPCKFEVTEYGTEVKYVETKRRMLYGDSKPSFVKKQSLSISQR